MAVPQGTLWAGSPQALVPLAGCVCSLALGLGVARRRWGSPLHLAFAALNAATALWNLDVLLLFTIRDEALAGAVDRLLQIPIVSIPFLGIFFVYTFLGRRRRDAALAAFAAWTGLLWWISGSSLFITGWERHWYGYWGRAGLLYPLFPLTILLYLWWSCSLLWREYRESRDHRWRNQVLYLMVASAVLVVFSLDNFLPLFGAEHLPLGNLASLFFVVVIAATMVRYQLLEVRLLFRYGVLYSLLTSLLTVIYWGMVLGLQGWFREGIFSGSLVMPMVPALGVAFSFGPLKRSLQERLDRRFFRSRAQMRERLAAFAADLAGAKEEEEVWEAAWAQGWSAVHPRWGAIVLQGPGEPRLRDRPGVSAAAAGALLDRFGGALPRGGYLPPGSGPRQGGGCTGGDAEYAVVVTGAEGIYGGCLLGPRRSGEIYGSEEAGFLDGIAGQCALALDRVRLQNRLRSRERLSTLGTAAAVVSHELRNPLNVMKGAVAVLRRRLGRRDSPDAPMLDIIQSAIDRGDGFINDFLSACREERLAVRRIDLNLYLADFAVAWPRGEWAGMRFPLDLSPGELWIDADPVRLCQVFDNLVRNAAEATAGRGTVRVRSGRAKSGEAEISFADDGPGIPPEALPALFEPFFTTRPTGTGLGLSIARGVITAHGGTLTAGAAPGGGADFTIRLPASLPAGGSAANTPKEGPTHDDAPR